MTQLVLDAFPEHVDDAALADFTLDTGTGTYVAGTVFIQVQRLGDL